MELMLRFCDSSVCSVSVLSGELRATVSAFPPAPLVVQASCPGGPEELRGPIYGSTRVLSDSFTRSEEAASGNRKRAYNGECRGIVFSLGYIIEA